MIKHNHIFWRLYYLCQKFAHGVPENLCLFLAFNNKYVTEFIYATNQVDIGKL